MQVPADRFCSLLVGELKPSDSDVASLIPGVLDTVSFEASPRDGFLKLLCRQ